MSDSSRRNQNVRKHVLNILETIPNTRNSDRELLVQYWSMYDNIPFDASFPHYFIKQATSPESITRCRRDIQASGQYLPTNEDVLRQRRLLSEEYRDHYAQRSRS